MHACITAQQPPDMDDEKGNALWQSIMRASNGPCLSLERILQIVQGLSPDQLQMRIDVTMFMHASPVVVSEFCSAKRVHGLYRQLGLRYILVNDMTGKLIGIVTRSRLTTETVGAQRSKAVLVDDHHEDFFQGDDSLGAPSVEFGTLQADASGSVLFDLSPCLFCNIPLLQYILF